MELVLVSAACHDAGVEFSEDCVECLAFSCTSWALEDEGVDFVDLAFSDEAGPG